MLEVENVYKKFGENNVLEDCSLSLAGKELVVIIGENGSGKSTLFNIISGVLRPDSGKIYLNGEDVTSEPIYRIAERGLYRSFQSSNLFENLTVMDHLLMVQDNSDMAFWGNLVDADAKRHEIKRAGEVLELLEITGKEESLISEISYGQRKLVNLGMCLLTYQKILLLDEIFAGVNLRLVEKVKDYLLDIKDKEDKGIVLISHDLAFAKRAATRVVYLKNGRIY